MPWSKVTAGGSATTWTAAASATSFLFIPFSAVTDALRGVDLVPKISSAAPWSVRAERPIVLWSTSSITGGIE